MMVAYSVAPHHWLFVSKERVSGQTLPIKSRPTLFNHARSGRAARPRGGYSKGGAANVPVLVWILLTTISEALVGKKRRTERKL